MDVKVCQKQCKSLKTWSGGLREALQIIPNLQKRHFSLSLHIYIYYISRIHKDAWSKTASLSCRGTFVSFLSLTQHHNIGSNNRNNTHIHVIQNQNKNKRSKNQQILQPKNCYRKGAGKASHEHPSLPNEI